LRISAHFTRLPTLPVPELQAAQTCVTAQKHIARRDSRLDYRPYSGLYVVNGTRGISMLRLFCAMCIVALSACEQPSVEAVIEVQASRAFAGPTQFPPSGFAGYGVLAFPSAPARSAARFDMFCAAYLAAFSDSAVLEARGVKTAQQMVTVLPVTSDDLAAELDFMDEDTACDTARVEYDLVQAQDAIRKAEAASGLTDGLRALTGRGPYLLAWAPGQTFGSRDALVLAADLSNSSSPEQAALDMQTWRRDIEQDPSQWRDGWNSEGIRRVAQRWVDRRGDAIIKLIGDWG